MRFFSRALVAFLFLLFLDGSAVSASVVPSGPALPDTVFQKCQFDLGSTEHLQVAGTPTGGNGQVFCSIRLASKGSELFGGAGVTVTVQPRGDNEVDDLIAMGFQEDTKGAWHFSGAPFLIIDPKIKKASLSKRNQNGQLLLIGRQTERGSIAQGGPLTISGVQIARITPQFVVTVGTAFDTAVTQETREFLISELATIVESVRTRP